ncbi:MAG: sensor histidine kinase [Rhodobacteraceae bacterium]|nr:sensor histidine kinase [Paracoccaceae bacterium]
MSLLSKKLNVSLSNSGNQTDEITVLHTHESSADQLLYKITHDLSETIRALVELPKWICEDLAEAQTEVSAEVQENLDALIVNGARLEQLINGLQTYSRVGFDQKLSVINLPAKMKELRQAIALPSSIKLTTHHNTDQLLAFEPDFSNLCLALLDNAVKHSDQQTRCLELKIVSTDHRIEVVMVDDGPGIPIHLRGKATQVLTSLSSKDEVEGSGIGLALALKTAESYRGTLLLETAFTETGRGLRVKACLKDPAIGAGLKVKNAASGLINS